MCYLRLGTIDDIDFVMKEAVIGAQKGHYARELLERGQAENFRNGLIQNVQSHSVSRLVNGNPTLFVTTLWIYVSIRGTRIGYLLLSERFAGSKESNNEISMIGVQSSFRRQGHGRNIVRSLMSINGNVSILYARCKRESGIMSSILMDAGFVLINTMPSGTEELEYCPS